MHKKKPVYIIDGSGYIFRAYYAIRPLSTRDGVPTHAVMGFARMLLKLVKDEQPAFLGIAFDTKDNFRHTIYPEYKANRDAPPEDLIPQFPLIHELVEAMDIPCFVIPGFEADDIIATLAAHAKDAGHDVIVVSGDKDLMQLVAPHVSMFDPMKNQHYDRAGVIERFGVPPEMVADVLALAGDTSDNIPGVPKVGPKSASKLINDYGDVEQVIAGITARSHTEPKTLKAFERSVIDNADLARLSKRLTVLRTDAPVPFDLNALAYTVPKSDKVVPFLRKIEAFALLRDMAMVSGKSQDNAHVTPHDDATPSPIEEEFTSERVVDQTDTRVTEQHAHNDSSANTPGMQHTDGVIGPNTQHHANLIDRSHYRGIFSQADLDTITHAIATVGRVSVDLETTSLEPTQADIVGISLCVPGHASVYIPVGHHYLGVPQQLKTDVVLAHLKPCLEDPRIGKVGQNIKYDRIVLACHGIAMQGITDDAMLAAYVLNPARTSYSLDALAHEILGHDTITYEDVTGTGKNQIGFDAVPIEQAIQYAAEDADVALRLCQILTPQVAAAGMSKLYHDLEIPLLNVLADIEQAGMLIDIQALHAVSHELTQRLHAIEQRAFSLIGGPINLASPKQLATLFFEKLGYPVIKKTKTGLSTDQDVLETLARTYELPGVILEHRLLSKLKSTYVDSLPRMVNPRTGRVHTHFNQAGTATGRLSSSDPNLQNIPVRSEDGLRIRKAFVAPPGCCLISADYSQIELRLVAHLSQDPHFIDAFKHGADIHQRTAQEILSGGAPVDAEMRRRAKAINFGILYGLSEFGLSKQLNISRGEARDYISLYFSRYPQIRVLLDQSIEIGRKQGYVTTLLGRRRYIPDLHSKNGNVRQAAERIAMNTPIQGSAADIIKLAMLHVADALKKHHHKTRLVLQVHDELLLEAPIEERDAIIALVREKMSQVYPSLSVPLVVDVGVGASWAEAH